MKIVVCVRQTPDTETLIKIASDGKSIETDGIKYVVGPFDEYSLEAAVQIKEMQGGEVTALSVGPARVGEALRNCLALGADKAVHVTTEASPTDDALVLATALAAQLKAMEFDLVFTSTRGADSDRGAVGPMLAQLLGIPYIGLVDAIEVGEGTVTCTRDVEGGAQETFEVKLPALVCAQKGIRGEPRYASLMQIMKAKKKPIQSVELASLGVDVDGSTHLVLEKLEYPPERPPGRIIDGPSLDAKIDELVRLLRDEAKVI